VGGLELHGLGVQVGLAVAYFGVVEHLLGVELEDDAFVEREDVGHRVLHLRHVLHAALGHEDQRVGLHLRVPTSDSNLHRAVEVLFAAELLSLVILVQVVLALVALKIFVANLATNLTQI
jgi:hypothetical protein